MNFFPLLIVAFGVGFFWNHYHNRIEKLESKIRNLEDEIKGKKDSTAKLDQEHLGAIGKVLLKEAKKRTEKKK